MNDLLCVTGSRGAVCSRALTLGRLGRLKLLAFLIAAVCLARTGADAQTNEVFIKGLHCGDDGIGPAEFGTAHSLGVTMLRLWDFPGRLVSDSTVEPNTNQWADYSGLIEGMISNGMTVVGVLFTQQPWRCNPNRPYTPNLDWANQPSLDQADISPWMDYVNQVTLRYKPWIHYWEIWNEPWTHPFWGHADTDTNLTWQEQAMDYTNYMECVRQASIIIRTNDAGTVIASCGLTEFGRECIAAGITNYCDIISVHYGYSGQPDPGRQLEYICAVRSMRAEAGGMPLWNTETNILLPQEDGPVPVLPAADAVTRILSVNKQAGVQAMFYYYMDEVDDGQPENLGNGSGLTPAAEAFGEFQ